MRATLREATLSGDTDAYAGCFTTNAFLMHQDTPYTRGAEAIKEHTHQIFDSVQVTRLELSPLVVDGAAATWKIAAALSSYDQPTWPPDEHLRLAGAGR